VSKVGDAVNRLLGRSVVDLAQAVDDALSHLAFCKGQQAEVQEALRVADEDVAQAQRLLESARDALFDEHPELRGGVTIVNPQDDWAPPGPAPTLPGQVIPEGLNPEAFDPVPIEVDDADDPRFTGGVPAVSPNEEDDLPPVVWTEHDE